MYKNKRIQKYKNTKIHYNNLLCSAIIDVLNQRHNGEVYRETVDETNQNM